MRAPGAFLTGLGVALDPASAFGIAITDAGPGACLGFALLRSEARATPSQPHQGQALRALRGLDPAVLARRGAAIGSKPESAQNTQ